MSLNRLTDDTCYYKRAIQQSVDPLSHVLDPNRFEHVHRCRAEFGVLGGNVASAPRDWLLVDTESELRNQTRAASGCPDRKYIPGKSHVVGEMAHLPSCQLTSRRAVPGATWSPSPRLNFDP